MTSMPRMDAASANPEIGQTLELGSGSGLETGKIVINYHDHGQCGDDEAVLLLHGSGPGVTAWSNWRTVLPDLAQTHRVIAPDLAGFGYTQEPENFVATPKNWVAQVVGLLDALGLDSVNVVGNSFGGALALHLAHHHPNRVKRLVLMGSVGISFPITEGLDKVWGYQPSLPAMRELMGIFAHDQSIISDDLVQMRYQASNREAVAARFARLFPAPRQEGVERLALRTSELRRITAPVALIHGRNDRVIPLAVSERLAQVLPNATLHALDACGHWVQIERREAFVHIVQNFLAGESAHQPEEIEGLWMIESWRQEYDDGRVVLPLGEHLTGFAEYRGGRVTIMLARADRAHFTTGGQWDASQEEKARAYETGLFYAGRFSIEGDTVLHEIDIASYPNWVGSTQKRRIVLQGDTLQLSARLEDGTPEARSAILQWRRAKEA